MILENAALASHHQPILVQPRGISRLLKRPMWNRARYMPRSLLAAAVLGTQAQLQLAVHVQHAHQVVDSRKEQT